MIVTDKVGHKVYVTWICDCDGNEGGFYCEVYSDKNFDHKIDDFCIHEGDCEHSEEGVKEYIKNYCSNEEFDLDYDFD